MVKTKRDFYESLRERLPAGTPIKVAKELTEAVCETVISTVSHGGVVKLPGIGTFGTRDTKARRVRLRHTGELIEVPPGRKVTFKPSTGLRRAIGESVLEGATDE